MSYTPLKATLGICISLASQMALASNAPDSPVVDATAGSYAQVVDRLALPVPSVSAPISTVASKSSDLQSPHDSPDTPPTQPAVTQPSGALISGLQDLSISAPAPHTTTLNIAPIITSDSPLITLSGDPEQTVVTPATSDQTIASDGSIQTQPTDGSTPNGPLNRIGQTLGASIDKIGEIGGKIGGAVGEFGDKIAVDANASQPDPVKDPFEHFNRAMWHLNSKLDQWILLPVATAYAHHVPQPVRTGVTNFMSNLRQPWTAVNNLLQGHPGTSVESLSRFVINTVTSLGFYDTAGWLGIPKSTEDFGQTLGVWGVGSGPFLMLPLIGPSTVRDSLAEIVDLAGSIPNYVPNNWTSLTTTAIRGVNNRSNLIGLEHFVEGDQYSLIRDIYLQNRQFQIYGTTKTTPTANAAADDFGDDGFGDDTSTGDKGTGSSKVAPAVISTPAAPAAQPVQF
jgi:phospholipid-binding lipoprotein MlaA